MQKDLTNWNLSNQSDWIHYAPIKTYFYRLNIIYLFVFFWSSFFLLSFFFCWWWTTVRHILSLSIADLMLILTAVPFVSVVYTLESWPWGTTVCMLSEFMKDFSTGVSVFTLVAMSLDRFVAIVNPLRRFRNNGKLFRHVLFGYLFILFGYTFFLLPTCNEKLKRFVCVFV